MNRSWVVGLARNTSVIALLIGRTRFKGGQLVSRVCGKVEQAVRGKSGLVIAGRAGNDEMVCAKTALDIFGMTKTPRTRRLDAQLWLPGGDETHHSEQFTEYKYRAL